jgi:hypothetical protein
MPWLSRYVPDISALSSFVSLYPYFKVHPGKLETVKLFEARITTQRIEKRFDFDECDL